MKHIVYISILLLIAISGFSDSLVNYNEMYQNYNNERRLRGVPTVYLDGKLAFGAYEYANILAEHRELSHYHNTWDAKFKSMQYAKGQQDADYSRYYELIAQIPITSRVEDRIAYVFDTSARHYAAFYDPKVKYVGFGVAQGPEYYWIAVYLAH